VSDDVGVGDRGSYGPKRALVLDEPDSKHGSEVADRLAMTTAEQCRISIRRLLGFAPLAAFSSYKEKTMARRDATA
jgi:hypothetical protein